ncbi:MAG: hypothetical protein HYW48_08270 [Deltaproteobacteria bacterium]|nr:hypothetical protein [Deltaproteobacteria bacterium]
MDRREFGKLLGLVTVGASLPSLAQEERCEELRVFEKAIAWPDEKIHYWVDGFRYDRSEYSTRAYLAVLIKHQQTKESYVDKIVLTTDDKTIVNASYFTEDDKISSSFLPYLTFYNLNLTADRYFLYIQVRESSSVKRFRYTFSLSKLNRSPLSSSYLPPQLRADLEKSFEGVVSTPYYYRRGMDLARHNIQAQLMQLEANNFFVLKVYFMHEDESPDHFMRYFIVTDPVGRIIALKKRIYGDGLSHFVLLSSLTEEERNRWGLTRERVAKINDCPYVMVFCDDVSEALMRGTIWLR